MFRYGVLTGNIYSGDVKPESIGECCVMCYNDEDLERAKAKQKLCEFCRGCPEYYRED